MQIGDGKMPDYFGIKIGFEGEKELKNVL